jgi:hypothetical protein
MAEKPEISLTVKPPKKTKAPTGNPASTLRLVALHQNSGALHRPGELARGIPHIYPADPRSEASERRKEFGNFPTNSSECFCVMDAPEIYHSPGLVVVSEFLPAIQASDVGSSAIAGSPG